MEKETEKSGYSLNNEEFGTVKIANDVVAMIAGLRRRRSTVWAPWLEISRMS